MDQEVYDIRKEQEREPAFDAIIPAPVRYNDDLRPNAKLMYGEIRSLCGRFGYCFATNSYFAKLYGMNERSIARFVKQLEALNFIRVVIIRDENGRVLGRRIYVVLPFESDENVTLNHMTKKSATCPKSQGEGDQKVSQYNNKNNINKKIYTCARKTDDSDARAELIVWAETLTDDPDELKDCLMEFCNMRLTRKKGPVPMKSGRSVTRLCNRLLRFSSDTTGKLSIKTMLEILDVSIYHEWIDVFPLNDDAPRDISGRAEKRIDEEAGDKWL